MSNESNDDDESTESWGFAGGKDDQGRPHGVGKLVYPSEDVYGRRVYDGSWHQGLWHGNGSVSWASGTTYSGTFKNGEMHGKGKITWSHGGSYEGAFDKGVRQGRGRYVYPCADRFGRLEYDGLWERNQKSGKGTLKWSSGELYRGDWLDGQRHGFGVHTWPDGSSFRGQWQHDARHGLGVFRWSGGQLFEGQWHFDKKHGVAILTRADGSKHAEIWYNGKRCRTYALGDNVQGGRDDDDDDDDDNDDDDDDDGDHHDHDHDGKEEEGAELRDSQLLKKSKLRSENATLASHNAELEHALKFKERELALLKWDYVRCVDLLKEQVNAGVGTPVREAGSYVFARRFSNLQRPASPMAKASQALEPLHFVPSQGHNASSNDSDDDVSKQSEEDVSKQSEDDVSSKDDVSKQSEDDVSKQSEDDVSKQSEDDVSSNDDVSKQSEEDVSKQSEDDVSSNDDVSKQSEDDVSKQSEDDVSSNDDVSKQSEDDVSKQSEDDVSSNDDVSKQSEDDVSKQSEDDVSSNDDVSKQSEDDVSKQSEDDVSKQSDALKQSDTKDEVLFDSVYKKKKRRKDGAKKRRRRADVVSSKRRHAKRHRQRRRRRRQVASGVDKTPSRATTTLERGTVLESGDKNVNGDEPASSGMCWYQDDADSDDAAMAEIEAIFGGGVDPMSMIPGMVADEEALRAPARGPVAKTINRTVSRRLQYSDSLLQSEGASSRHFSPSDNDNDDDGNALSSSSSSSSSSSENASANPDAFRPGRARPARTLLPPPSQATPDLVSSFDSLGGATEEAHASGSSSSVSSSSSALAHSLMSDRPAFLPPNVHARGVLSVQRQHDEQQRSLGSLSLSSSGSAEDFASSSSPPPLGAGGRQSSMSTLPSVKVLSERFETVSKRSGLAAHSQSMRVYDELGRRGSVEQLRNMFDSMGSISIGSALDSADDDLSE
jgi:hypothetical protein